MILFKTLLAGLTGVSLSIANISGIVTDTGSTPIFGAVVQLEKGGQKASTEIDGSFTLKVTTATFPSTGTMLPNSFSPRITGNRLDLTIAQKSVVEITKFNLSGKALSIVRQKMDAGKHSLMLPQGGAGICLYKVKAGSIECVLKSNATCGITSGSSVLSSNHQMKQAKTMATFDDVISVTKTGYLNYRVVAYSSDTSGIEIKMMESAGTITDADGNVYQTVKIGKQVWMAENLRTTKYDDGSAIPLVADSAAWYPRFDSSISTPAYCYYNNTANTDSIRKFGALYNWYVISSTNPKRIAPTGWHVPIDADWDTLRNYLAANGYNWAGATTVDWIAKSLAGKTDWRTQTIAGAIGCDLIKNNISGFTALPGGGRSNKGIFSSIGTDGYWWSIRQGSASSGSRYKLYYGSPLFAWQDLSGRDLSSAFSIRLLRNY